MINGQLIVTKGEDARLVQFTHVLIIILEDSTHCQIQE